MTNCSGVGPRSIARLSVSCGCSTTAAISFFLFLGGHLTAQSASPQALPADPVAAGGSLAPSGSNQSPDGSEGQQTKRILGIAPNFQAVSAGVQLPPLSPGQKFRLATSNTFDYSAFISVGISAAIEQETTTYPEFHQGAAAFGRYYWHAFADSVVENYLAGAILPAITHEDPRYYTLYRGGVVRRTRYAITRLCIIKTDAGGASFNYSEILGSGLAAAVSSRYYPRQERGASETLQRWAGQLLNDGVGNVFEEFWPDINHKFFHRH